MRANATLIGRVLASDKLQLSLPEFLVRGARRGLCRHPQLESNLRLAINEALAQRIVMRVRLQALTTEEVGDYLSFRLELAGRTAALFLKDATEAVSRAGRGVPRIVDRLAEHSMLIAMRERRKEIDAEIVTQAIDEVDP